MRTVLVVVAALVVIPSAQAQPTPVCNGITHKMVTVDSRNPEWTDVNAVVQAGDIVLVGASGKVSIGKSSGEVDAKGVGGNGLGRLNLRIGHGDVINTGKKWVGLAPESGSVKLRVEDTNYSDNSGSYLVHVMIVPAAIVPPPVEVVTRSALRESAR
jgi:hypothetical protein